MTFEQLPLKTNALLKNTQNLEQRFQDFGMLENTEIILEAECICGGTVIVNCKYGKFCLRRKEVKCDVLII